MAALSTIIGAAGAATAAAGVGAQVYGMVQANRGEKRAEKIRQAQMQLEGTRERRNIVRQAMQARAAALVSAESQGASAGSGLQGGLAQISGQAGSATLGVNQNQDLGIQMFGANRQISNGNTISAVGGGMQSLGGSLVQNSQGLGRLGQYAFGFQN